MIIEFVVIISGLLISVLLFYRFPVLKGNGSGPPKHKISVIIPARNEAESLPLLLENLANQTMPAYEILCADDGSTDDTALIALSHGVKLISAAEKPEGWVGKAWACQNGADAADGDLLLFLDADVRIGPDGIRRLAQEFERDPCVLSVQPYHQTVKQYEQFSMFLNLIQYSANGLGLPCKNRNVGLCGPIILIPKEDYHAAGGFEAVKGSIIDDIALGGMLRRKGISYKLFLGDKALSYRMYGDGFRSLLQGWIKNMASGALKTPILRFASVFLWITACTSVPIQFVKALSAAEWKWMIVFAILYIVCIVELRRISRHIGRFGLAAIIFYPIPLAVCLGVFAVSVGKRLTGGSVIWKGRKIRPGK